MTTDLATYKALLNGSEPEETLYGQLQMVGLADYRHPLTREYVFAPPRKWRFDFAWRVPLVAVEVEGGVYVAGRHSRGAGYEADCEKYNTAVIMGWAVLRVTPKQIESGEALKWCEALLR